MDYNFQSDEAAPSNNMECYKQKNPTFISTSDSNTRIDQSDPRSMHHFYKVFYKSGSTIKVWECSICGREFQHKYLLRRHLPGHTDERNYHCQVCGKSFRQLSTLSQHQTIHSHARPHTCMVCNKRFNRISTLISHRKTHRNDKPFKCHICDKGFHQKGNLRNHLYSHTNERPYRCVQCDKGFNQQSNLTCHMKKVHSGIQAVTSSLDVKKISENKITNSTEDTVKQITKSEKGEISTDNKIPFALLKVDNEQAALVKMYPASVAKGNHLLVPVSSQDLITGGKLVSEMNTLSNISENNSNIVKLYIPIVAIIESTMKPNGKLSIAVHPPSTNNTSPSDILMPKIFVSSDSANAVIEDNENLLKIIDPDNNITTNDPRNYFLQTMTQMPVEDPNLNSTQQSEGSALIGPGLYLSSPQYLLESQEFDCRHMELFESLEAIETGKIKNELLTQLQDASENENTW